MKSRFIGLILTLAALACPAAYAKKQVAQQSKHDLPKYSELLQKLNLRK